MTPATTAACAMVLLVAGIALGGLLVILAARLIDRAAKGKCERSCARAYAAYDVPVRVPGQRAGGDR